jgi:hypothetical protein
VRILLSIALIAIAIFLIAPIPYLAILFMTRTLAAAALFILATYLLGGFHDGSHH